jgi:hypothetical protein
MRKIWFLLLLLASFFEIKAQGNPLPEASPSEVASVDAIIKSLYDVISGPAGQARNWNKFRSLFRPEARLTSIGKDAAGKSRLLTMAQEDYIRNAGATFMEKGFFEKELGRSTEKYGDMVHLLSAYETRFTPDGKIEARGVNSIQLLFKDGRYWIVNIMWVKETPENPIPERLLKKG